MIATVMAAVAPKVMTTALVSWKEAMVPTMYDKLRVTTTCGHNVQPIKPRPISQKAVFILPL